MLDLVFKSNLTQFSLAGCIYKELEASPVLAVQHWSYDFWTLSYDLGLKQWLILKKKSQLNRLK